MIEEEVKSRLDFLDARLDTVTCRMDEKIDAVTYRIEEKLDEVVYSPVVSELDIIRNDIENLRMLLDRLNIMVEHEREQRKKFMIALVEAGEEGLL